MTLSTATEKRCGAVKIVGEHATLAPSTRVRSREEAGSSGQTAHTTKENSSMDSFKARANTTLQMSTRSTKVNSD